MMLLSISSRSETENGSNGLSLWYLSKTVVLAWPKLKQNLTLLLQEILGIHFLQCQTTSYEVRSFFSITNCVYFLKSEIISKKLSSTCTVSTHL